MLAVLAPDLLKGLNDAEHRTEQPDERRNVPHRRQRDGTPPPASVADRTSAGESVPDDALVLPRLGVRHRRRFPSDNTRRYASAKRSAMGLLVSTAARRRISLGSSSASNALRKRRSCERIDRNNLNLYRITAQEKTEKVSSRNRTAWVIGLAIPIKSKRSARPVTRVSWK
jgi:hypothetical protein